MHVFIKDCRSCSGVYIICIKIQADLFAFIRYANYMAVIFFSLHKHCIPAEPKGLKQKRFDYKCCTNSGLK